MFTHWSEFVVNPRLNMTTNAWDVFTKNTLRLPKNYAVTHTHTHTHTFLQTHWADLIL